MVHTKSLTGLPSLAYKGVESPTPPNFNIFTRAPTTNDYKEFNIGDLWLQYRSGYPSTGTVQDLWVLIQKERATGTWVNFASASPSVTYHYITDNGTATPNASGELHIDTNNASSYCGASVLFTGSSNYVQLSVTDTQENTTIGEYAGSLLYTTGTRNTSLGDSTLQHFTSGDDNTGMGASTLQAITTGSNNTMVGSLSGIALTTQSDNTGLGYYTLHNLEDSYNVAVGSFALSDMVTGIKNVAVGYNVLTLLSDFTHNSFNTIIGSDAAESATSMENTTAVGENALGQILTGTDNIAIGASSGLNYIAAETNNILIGNGGTTGDNDAIRIGNLQTTAYMAGINGNTVSNEKLVTINSITNQLGVTDISNTVTVVQGSWTPTITIGGSGSGITYGTGTAGNYIIVRSPGLTYPLVLVEVTMNVTNKGSSSGIVEVVMPFYAPAATFSDTCATYTAIRIYNGVTLPSGASFMGIGLNNAPNYGTPLWVVYSNGTSSTNLQASNCSTSFHIVAGFWSQLDPSF